MEKQIQTGSVIKLNPLLNKGDKAWYIPHHLFSHNGQHWLVFKCSFQHRGQNLNDYPLLGTILGASLLGVLVRFHEHAVAVGGDMKSMFHQVCLLPEDHSLFCFLCHDLC